MNRWVNSQLNGACIQYLKYTVCYNKKHIYHETFSVIYVCLSIYSNIVLFSFVSTSRLIVRCLSQAMITTVAIIIAIPISPNRLNSFPKKAHPKKAAEIGSIDEEMDPGTATILLTPSK